MRFDVITILPMIFAGFRRFGVCGRALADGRAALKFWNPRDYADGVRRQVDDSPFGGGCGMVLMAEPLSRAIEAAKNENRGEVVCLSPRGEPLTDVLARRLSKRREMILVCGRYRGVDERAMERHASLCVSAGDYVLSGGEVAAMALMEAALRHCPGVLGASESAEEESFADGLLDAPCYTRPAVWRGEAAPEALLSGDHEKIRQWRRTAAQELTRRHRPDLLAAQKKSNAPGDKK